MGAHAIFINTKTKTASSTSYPMSVIEKNCDRMKNNLFTVNDSFFNAIEQRLIHRKDFLLEKENLVIVSDAHGQYCASDVVFNDDGSFELIFHF